MDKKEITIAVRELAQRLYSSGDLTIEFFSNHSATEGTKAHRYLQELFSKNDVAELYIKKEFELEKYIVTLQGFIDGVRNIDDKVTIEEIKSTTVSLDEINEDYHKEHVAQLKLYMALFALNNDLNELSGRLTYISLNTYKTKEIEYLFTKEELYNFLYESISMYVEWIDLLEEYKAEKEVTIKALKFPYPEFRTGQKDMMKAVYYTLKNKKILYAEAPTGIGKTISALYPAIKLLDNDNKKIFYLSSKNSQKELAISSMNNMIENGLVTRLVELTSKEKSCFISKRLCNPEACPYAKDFFSKINNAIKDVLKNELLITKDVVFYYARKHEVCPFELSLDLSNYSDVVVCDYNYAFDPISKLVRYFSESENDIYLLVDEAHNLIDRSRDMYTSMISYSSLKMLKKLLKKKKPTITRELKELQELNELLEKDMIKDKIVFDSINQSFIDSLYSIEEKVKNILANQEYKKDFPKREEVLLLYFEIHEFLIISEYYSSSSRFIFLKDKENDDYQYVIKCLDASKNLLNTINEYTKGTVFFSATLSPIEYNKALLTCSEGEHIILPSPFDNKNQKLIFINNISTYYKDREKTKHDLVDIIEIMTKSKEGNYIVFFPSYQYINIVKDVIKERYDSELIIQESDLSEQKKTEILSEFEDTTTPKLGLFVMGGMFAEGIDYLGDKLSGVIIVGVGIPQINDDTQLLEKYYNSLEINGFDYAYVYPGFNKVLQAAGRVIRSPQDRGIITIVDPRITDLRYLNVLPRHWNNYKIIRSKVSYKKEIDNFWNIK